MVQILSDRFIRIFPVIFLCALIVVGGIRLQIMEISPWPHFMLMGVFFWALYSPNVLSTFSLLWLGMFFDMVHGLPVGVSAIIALLLNWMVDSQRRFLLKEPFWVVWLACSLMLTMVMVVNYLLMALLLSTVSLDSHMAVMMMLSMASYPIFHRICMALYFDRLQYVTQQEG